jgi:hypothetical protein
MYYKAGIMKWIPGTSNFMIYELEKRSRNTNRRPTTGQKAMNLTDVTRRKFKVSNTNPRTCFMCLPLLFNLPELILQRY